MRKYLVLKYVSENGFVQSQEVSDVFDLTIHNARMCLLTYYRQGLLNREKEFGVYVYWMTPKGYERLEWLENNY